MSAIDPRHAEAADVLAEAKAAADDVSVTAELDQHRALVHHLLDRGLTSMLLAREGNEVEGAAQLGDLVHQLSRMSRITLVHVAASLVNLANAQLIDQREYLGDPLTYEKALAESGRG